ncbi:MAG: UDP-N-acetyl-D-glucosamine dehydrogenase [Candidatus Wallbacteria bacterium HGW-Wallbacteria-1]|jgi:predicted dehydrogenase|uniref:UDP-N-acetyl-D-glucosamine dehydrogenase n=1 Tax=Candidatus Wallbacteria bacterium HGW-Wallbacteria-1 TaxID=2013854 RepID=A0A2N1PT17_9BACT|nr:MAG: UDP-N-acetyl-D-glucosamine dehydrogenase [Candidatus Wallbacteria bacterium HGW-Wallbacteria-1]
MTRLRIAVIGVGHLGKNHARVISELPQCELAGVCDLDEESLNEVSSRIGVPAFTDYTQLLGKVDAVTVVVPTALHHRVSSFFLDAGVHVLCEKPVTKSLEEARSLIALAEERKVLLQIGHIERFNAAFMKVCDHIGDPRYIECQRLGPFTPRVRDVGVVLDLMIHDIDLVLSLIDSPIERIDAMGVRVFTPNEDMANAHIVFRNGCIANINASRLTKERVRKLRVFTSDSYYSLDFGEQSFKSMKLDNGQIAEHEFVQEEKREPLKDEISHFVECISQRKQPMVTGVQGRDALAVALMILDEIQRGWSLRT